MSTEWREKNRRNSTSRNHSFTPGSREIIAIKLYTTWRYTISGRGIIRASGRGSQIKSRWRSEKNAIMCRKMRDSRRGCIVSRICDLMERCTIFVCESESFEISLEILFLFLVYTLSRIVYKLYMIRMWMYKMKKNDWGCRERANLKQKFGIFGGESRGRVISCEMRNNW